MTSLSLLAGRTVSSAAFTASSSHTFNTCAAIGLAFYRMAFLSEIEVDAVKNQRESIFEHENPWNVRNIMALRNRI